MLNFTSVRKIRFLGIGGVSMSSLARFFLLKGYDVSGTDKVFSDALLSLRNEGVCVNVGFDPSLIGSVDLAVYSSAVPSSDPELVYLRSCGVPCLERHSFLPYLSEFFSSVVAIGGTHGKTTVTSMCAVIMKENGLRFYAHIGGTSRDLGPFYYSGDDCLLTEACEYRRSMLSVSPSVAVVLNAEVDHPDTYRDKSDVFDAFDDFLASSRGLKIVGEGEYYRLRQKPFSPITFGFSAECDYRAIDINVDKNGCYGFRILRFGVPFCDIKLSIPGKCNLTDALAATAVCASIGIKGDVIKTALNSFSGVKRRFEFVGEFEGNPVYVDYAHHPTEILAALDTAYSLGRKFVTVVFQPHTFSRTARLKEEFVSALTGCDRLIIMKEYAARETPSDGTSALALFRECKNKEKYYAANLVDAAALLYKKTAPGEIILVVGAGDVVNLSKIIIPTT